MQRQEVGLMMHEESNGNKADLDDAFGAQSVAELAAVYDFC